MVLELIYLFTTTAELFWTFPGYIYMTSLLYATTLHQVSYFGDLCVIYIDDI